MTVFTLHLIRHGRTDWNAAGRVQGHRNSELSELGHRQAQATGKRLASVPLSALYSSDLGRAQQTANHIGDHVNLEVRTEPRVKERGFGIVEGLTWPQIEAKHPEVHAALRKRSFTYRAPGGESRQQATARTVAGLDAIAATHPNEHVAVVSHGGTIGFFLRHVLWVPDDAQPRVSVANCSISQFEKKNGHWRLVTWGGVDHLDDTFH